MNKEFFLAKVLSYLFHPLLLPTMGLFLIFHLDSGLWIPDLHTQLLLYLLTFITTFFLPLLSALFLLQMKQIESLEMITKEERKVPFLLAAVFYLSESYFLMRWEVPVLVKAMMLGATLILVSVLIINLFWKISSHMAGIGGLFGMMIAISFRLQIDIPFLLIALILIAGLIAFSRLVLKAHGSAQVYIGFLLGVFVQLMLFI